MSNLKSQLVEITKNANEEISAQNKKALGDAINFITSQMIKAAEQGQSCYSFTGVFKNTYYNMEIDIIKHFTDQGIKVVTLTPSGLKFSW